MQNIKLTVSFISILLVFTVIATAYSYYVYPPAYGGTSAYYRRYYYAPSSQQYYFGSDWNKPLGGFGSKGTWSSTPRVEGGSKGYNSPTANLLSNDFTPQGGNFNKISNFDPRFRGYDRLDTVVILNPYNFGFQSRNGLLVNPSASARLISEFGAFGTGSRGSNWQDNNAAPASEIYFQSRDLIPLGSAQRFELWLFDQETSHAQSLGLVFGGLGGTAQSRIQISKPILLYDFVGLTIEPFPDDDPSPGQLIMLGAIDSARQKECEAFARTLT